MKNTDQNQISMFLKIFYKQPAHCNASGMAGAIYIKGVPVTNYKRCLFPFILFFVFFSF